MAGSLLDFDGIAQLAQGNLRNAMQMKQMGLQRERIDIDRAQMEQEGRRQQQTAVFKTYDEMEKLANTPYFASPHRQIDLRFQQAQLLKMGLGMDIPMPSKEEMVGNHEQFAENLRLFRQGADPATREDAFERMVLSMPGYGKQLIDTMKDAGQMDERAEALRMKLELHGPKLEALNQKTGRVALQQGLFSENMGAIAQTVSIAKDPKFQAHLTKLQGMSEQARQIYLKMNPQFQQEFTQALKPHLEKIGAVGPEFEEALGGDVKPGVLRALDEEIDARLKAKNEAIERDGVAPVELGEEISGMDLVRKARLHQYQWMRDPFNKDKFQGMLKAQQDIRIAYDATGKTLAGIQNERAALAQQKFDAGQQEKLASDYAQEVFRQKLNEGHNENDAAVLAGKAAGEKYPSTPYNADKLKAAKPLVDLKLNTSQTASEEAAKDFMKETRQTYNQLKQAPAVLNNIEKAKELVPLAKGFMGPGGEGLLAAAKFLNSRLGANIDVKGVTAVEELGSRLFVGILDNLKKLDSQPSIEQQRIMMDALGRIGTDPNALPRVLDVYGDVLREKIDIHNTEVADAKKNGVVFPYNPTISAPAKRKAQQPQPGASPSGKAAPSSGQPSPEDKGGVANIKSDAEFNKLPSGAIFIGPDGKKRRKP